VGASENIKTIQTVYEAFGRGDVPAILERLTDDVDWAAEASSSAAPWYGTRSGKDAATAFFAELAGALEVQEFVPLTYAANDDDVLTVVRFSAKSRDTGKTETMQIHHWFRFRDGQIAYYRGTEDTALTAEILSA
jgi:ketosteroid isomerase-like protein